jgi:hypothetical protein
MGKTQVQTERSTSNSDDNDNNRGRGRKGTAHNLNIGTDCHKSAYKKQMKTMEK